MRKFFLLIALLLISNIQSQNLDKGSIQPKIYFDEIPFEYLRNKIIIPIVIDNKTYRFILDTGAPNVLSKNLSNLINPNFAKTVSLRDANNKSGKMGITTIPEMKIGNITFINSTALVNDDEKNIFFDCFKVEGFIGSNLFSNSIIQIDLQRKILRITNNKNLINFNKESQQKVELVNLQKSPYFKISLGKDHLGSEWVMLDTGMDGLYDLSKKHYELFKKHDIVSEIGTSQGGEAVGIFGADLDSVQHKLLLSEMKIGNHKFTNIEVITTNDDNSRIGTEILKYCMITLNYKDKKIYFDSYPEYNLQTPIDLTERSRKISITIVNNKLVVGFIWDETLKSKIIAGDEIISIGEINYENKSICEIMFNKPNMHENKTVDVVIKTKTGDLITVTN